MIFFFSLKNLPLTKNPCLSVCPAFMVQLDDLPLPVHKRASRSRSSLFLCLFCARNSNLCDPFRACYPGHRYYLALQRWSLVSPLSPLTGSGTATTWPAWMHILCTNRSIYSCCEKRRELCLVLLCGCCCCRLHWEFCVWTLRVKPGALEICECSIFLECFQEYDMTHT